MSLLLAFLLGAAAGDDPFAAILAKLRETAAKSVVAIDVERESDPDGITGSGAVSQHRDYYNRPKGPTSGVIYEADGIILTSRFNVSGGIRKNGIKVTLWDGRQLPGELLGTDEQRDIALVKIDAKELPVLPRADASAIGQGTFVALLGRSPDRSNPTVNLGILSATSRMHKTAVQTDAEMNYGNAGGALLTLKGELVGVACNIKPDTVWGQSGGVGFACKIAEIDALLPRLKKGEKIEAEKRPFLGIRAGEGNPDVEGIQVADVIKDSPAEKAGIKKEDVLVELAGVKITDSESLKEALEPRKIGEEIELKVMRKGKDGWQEKAFKLKLEGRAEP
ncbi:MAG TPA: trypsin-like peptidase domain-containing protein [Planctomycetota bacterium]|jgi:S1-C subfamily serine protease|nr:trypsin-like peptidase domain-containing protein [Planctomycetota bacterium]